MSVSLHASDVTDAASLPRRHWLGLSLGLGLALAAVNFVVLGLAVASVNPRAARSTSLVFALFAFVVYYNLMTLGQSWVGAGRLGLTPFMVLLHGGMLLASLAVLGIRHNQWSLRRLWTARSAGGTA